MSTKDRWEKIINEWSKTAEIAKHWCQKHQVSYISFISWRKRLRDLNSSNVKPSSFIEVLEEKNEPFVIELEFQSITLRLKKGFDEEIIRKCLSLIKTI